MPAGARKTGWAAQRTSRRGAANSAHAKRKGPSRARGALFLKAGGPACGRATAAGYWAASRHSPRRNRMTDCLNSAWSPRRTRPSGLGRSPGWPPATRRSHNSLTSLADRNSRSGSTGRSRTSLTAAHAPPYGNCGSRSAPDPSRSVYRRNEMPTNALGRQRGSLKTLFAVTVAALIFTILLLLVRLQWATLESIDHGAAAHLNGLVANHATLVKIIKARSEERRVG